MGHILLLKGIQPYVVKMIQQGKMDKLLAQPADLCMISIGVLKEASHEENATFLPLERFRKNLKPCYS